MSYQSFVSGSAEPQLSPIGTYDVGIFRMELVQGGGIAVAWVGYRQSATHHRHLVAE
jgi:hypothetical protein